MTTSQTAEEHAPYDPRVLLASEQVFQGAIVYLPAFEDVKKHCEERTGKVYKRLGVFERPTDDTESKYWCFLHPALVVSRPASNPGLIHFCIMNTFHGKTLKQWISGPQERNRPYARYLAFGAKKLHPLIAKTNHPFDRGLYRSLELKDGVQMVDPGYVGIEAIYEIDWQDMVRFYDDGVENRQSYILDDESLERVLRVLELYGGRSGYRPGAQYEHISSMEPAEELHDAAPWSFWASVDAMLESVFWSGIALLTLWTISLVWETRLDLFCRA